MMVSPGFSRPKKHGLVGLRARVRLHVGVLGAEQLLHAVDRQLLGDVDELAAAVVALAGIALGVLVGQLGALRRHHGRRGVVLGGDQLDVLFLAPVLGLDGGPDLGIDVGDGGSAYGRTWWQSFEASRASACAP